MVLELSGDVHLDIENASYEVSWVQQCLSLCLLEILSFLTPYKKFLNGAGIACTWGANW